MYAKIQNSDVIILPYRSTATVDYLLWEFISQIGLLTPSYGNLAFIYGGLQIPVHFKFVQGLSGSKRKNGKENKGIEQINRNSIDVGERKENGKRIKKVTFADSHNNQVIMISQNKAMKSRKTADPVKYNGGNDDKQNATKAKHIFKSKIVSLPQTEVKKEDIVLPAGKPLVLPVEDVGGALQFLQFCTTFSEKLGMESGQADSVLQNIASKRSKGLKGHSAFVQFLVKLLSMIFENVEKDGVAWLGLLKTCIEESECKIKDLDMDFIKMGAQGINNLDPSRKLFLLNFLCDEVLLTDELRKFIEESETKLDEGRREIKEKVAEAKKKEKQLKQDVKDKITKAMISARDGTPLSLSEFDKLLLNLREETDKVQAEITASIALVPKKNQRSDAVRTEPILLDGNGKMFWKLSCYNSGANIILQDIGNWNSVTAQDKWFVYVKDEEEVAEKYIESLRNAALILSSDNVEDDNEMEI